MMSTMRVLALVVAAVALAGPGVAAQYFPPAPMGVTTLRSRFDSAVTISYKEVSEVVLRLFCWW